MDRYCCTGSEACVRGEGIRHTWWTLVVQELRSSPQWRQELNGTLQNTLNKQINWTFNIINNKSTLCKINALSCWYWNKDTSDSVLQSKLNAVLIWHPDSCFTCMMALSPGCKLVRCSFFTSMLFWIFSFVACDSLYFSANLYPSSDF